MLDKEGLAGSGPTNFGHKIIEVLETRLSRVIHHNSVPDKVNESAISMDVYDYQYLCRSEDQIFLADADTLHEEIDDGIYTLIP
jgi:hypothetical protein